MTALRFPVALGSGGLFAVGMFYVLWSFVDVPMDFGEVIKPTRVQYSRTKFATQENSKRVEKVTREPPPVIIDLPRISTGGNGIERLTAFVRPQFARATVATGVAAGSDRDAIPLVRVEPVYPPRELARGTEGWVHVQFTIAANGSVKNAFVVAAAPPSAFEAAALAAIARWRYQPRVEGGVPVERVGMQTVIRFSLTDE